MGRWVWILVLLAGCTSGPEAMVGPELEWTDTYVLMTTPVEPFEEAGTNIIAYDGDLVGFYAEREDGMPRFAVRDGDTLYTSDFEMGWTRYDDVEDLPGARAYRYIAWDIKGLVEDADAYDGAYQGEFTFRGQTSNYSVHPDLRVYGSFDVETPYTVTESAEPLPFDLRVPDALRPDEVEPLDAAARDAHATVIGWIQDYVQVNGRVPETVDADTLALQRLGEPWPDNPFDGGPLRADESSGHFSWTVCGSQDALYIGYGHDGGSTGDSFGASC